jgi:hypothetical protein
MTAKFSWSGEGISASLRKFDPITALAATGRAWIVASLLCGVCISAWTIAVEARFDDANGIAGAAVFFAAFVLTASWGAALASIPWMAIAGFPVAVVLVGVDIKSRSVFFAALLASILAGLIFELLSPQLWWTGAHFAAPAYGAALGYFLMGSRNA